MPYNVKEIVANKPSRFTAGHRMCAGCGAPPAARMIMRALKPEDHAVVAGATGCMEVSTFIYPYTAWTDSFIHTAFECAAATLSGTEAAYQSLKKQGKISNTTKFIAFGGPRQHRPEARSRPPAAGAGRGSAARPVRHRPVRPRSR